MAAYYTREEAAEAARQIGLDEDVAALLAALQSAGTGQRVAVLSGIARVFNRSRLRTYGDNISEPLEDCRPNTCHILDVLDTFKWTVGFAIGHDVLSSRRSDAWQRFQSCRCGGVDVHQRLSMAVLSCRRC